MKIKDTQIIQGGLMRCCLQTIREYYDAHQEDEVSGDLFLDCRFEQPENQQILLRGGKWQWAGIKAVGGDQTRMRPNLKEIEAAVDVIDRAINNKGWSVLVRTKGMPEGQTEFSLILSDPQQNKKFTVWKRRIDNTNIEPL